MVRRVSARWETVVLVCGKCSRRQRGGFGKKGRKPLTKELASFAGAKRGRKSRAAVIETGCLKICPRHGVVALNAARPAEWLIIPAGSEVAEAAWLLGLDRDEPRVSPAVVAPSTDQRSGGSTMDAAQDDNARAWDKAGVAIDKQSNAQERLRDGDPHPVRDAGPDEMRDEDGEGWDEVDERSDESFPASDPPSYSSPKKG